MILCQEPAPAMTYMFASARRCPLGEGHARRTATVDCQSATATRAQAGRGSGEAVEVINSYIMPPLR